MKKRIFCLLILSLLLTGCATTIPETAPTETTIVTETTAPVVTETTAPVVTETTEATVQETEEVHSELYIPDLPVEDVIRYFCEVCLDAEYLEAGSDASVIQKWEAPIYYQLSGTATEEDLAVLTQFAEWLNQLPGFPGIQEATDAHEWNMDIYFCTKEELPNIMGENFAGDDGAVTIWWYTETNEIHRAAVCCAIDVDRLTRNSVILEEIYNSLGPLQDTALRQESIIYAGFSQPQTLHPVDELILKLLYNPQIRCGMNREECEAVIRQLYY